ncbi:MAG: GTP-binding protein [Clostridiales bacterium]|nr:GTP-binding protein [Clostridiales bacterium]
MIGLLKFITCGSVDDGKSTLIGHILYDSKLLYADQEKALLLDSRVGSRGGEIDYSLLLDGLMAEREQGITIDVAYRYFTTDKRSFIVADTPGHEEYTRNMAVGASFAQLAVILVDAQHGVLAQTRRHCRICALMGIHHFVFAVNKMDLVDYSEEKFRRISGDIRALARELELPDVAVIPVSATEGDNVTVRSEHMPWYTGKNILSYLETVDVTETVEDFAFYMPVQRVCRPDRGFRGFQGQIESGSVKTGQTLFSLPSKEAACVKTILVGDQKAEEAFAGQAVTLSLDREVDVSRGCVLSDHDRLPVAQSFRATLLWMDDTSLFLGKEYMVKIGTMRIPGIVTAVEYKIDVNTGKHLPASSIEKNEIAMCQVRLTEKIVLDTFKNHRTLGELILIDRVSHMTAACGVVDSVDTSGERLCFEKGDIRMGGYIFEELYFNLESGVMSRAGQKSRVYHVGDFVPVSGDSFQYPEYFDILSLEDASAVRIRDRRIQDILRMEDYTFGGLPVLDERGFSINIHNAWELETLMEEYEKAKKEESVSRFRNKWFRFETWRKVVCGDPFRPV